MAEPEAESEPETPPVTVEAHVDDVEDEGSSNASPDKPRHRQNFSWQQLAILEQVFDQDPLPKLVSAVP